MSERVDVLISGAGPTGLMAAALLVRCGVKVRIVDKNEHAVKESRALALQARSVELLAKMGLEKTVLEAGIMANGAKFIIEGTETAQFNFDDVHRDDTPYVFVLFLPQSRLEEILVADLKSHGLEVERGREFKSMVDKGDSIEAQVGDETIECSYLLGADGSHSAVRKALKLEFTGAPYDAAFYLADCHVEGLDDDYIKMMMHHKAFAIQFPLLGNGLSRLIVMTDDTTSEQGSSSDVTLDQVQTALHAATGKDIKLSDPVWLSRYKVHHRGVKQYRVGRAFVAGDAAHIHSPAGGQGMNTGLQDAANLAWKLALVLKQQAPDSLLDTYNSERQPIGEKVLQGTDKAFGVMADNSSNLKTLVREKLGPLLASTLTRLGAVRSRAFHFISQLAIRYHPSMAVAEPGPSKTLVKPGYRAPDAQVQRQLQVFDLIAGYDFVLLALSRRSLNAQDVQEVNARLEQLRTVSPIPVRTFLVANYLGGRSELLVRAENGQVFHNYGLEETTAQALVLIRPDGHVAWSAAEFDWVGLVAFIKQLASHTVKT